MVEIMEFGDGGIAGFQHLDIELAGDCFHLLGPEATDEAIHQLAPGPEAIVLRPRLRAGLLGQPRHGALEGVAVEIGHAGDDGAGGAKGGTRRGAGLDRGDVALRADPDQHILGPALGQQRMLGEYRSQTH